MEKVLFSWSTGKDSALALYELQKRQDIEIAALITTVTDEYDRVSMHGVRRELLHRQAAALGLPLREIGITKNASNDEYEDKMCALLVEAQAEGVTSVVFGDIFLEDLRKYREEKLAQVGMHAIFPLWKKDTHALVGDMVQLGFKAIVTCVDTQVLGQEFSGRVVDKKFLEDLPETKLLSREQITWQTNTNTWGHIAIGLMRLSDSTRFIPQPRPDQRRNSACEKAWVLPANPKLPGTCAAKGPGNVTAFRERN